MKEELAIKLLEIILKTDSPEEPKSTPRLCGHLINEYVLIRTYSAGVHFGKLIQREGKEAVLNESRRIWSWDGAFTLSKVANNGVGSGKLSETVDNFLVTEVIELMPLTSKAKEGLYGIESHKG